MRLSSMAFAAAASLLVASPLAVAFEVHSAPTMANGTSNFTDPDVATDNMAAHLTDDGAASGGSSLHFGSTTLTISGGNGSNVSTMSPALQEQFMGGFGGSTAIGIPNH